MKRDSRKAFDGLLVLEFQRGNKRALSLLVKRYHKDFCSYAYWYTRNFEMSQDIVQESWGAIFKGLKTLKKPDSFKSWAMRIVTRKAQDQLAALSRKRRFEKNLETVTEGDDSADHKEEQLVLLNRAIMELSDDHRIVLRLFYLESQSLKEISEILEITVGTVKSRLYHAREKLKSKIK